MRPKIQTNLILSCISFMFLLMEESSAKLVESKELHTSHLNKLQSVTVANSDEDFDNNLPSIIRAVAGTTAYLSCKPKASRNKTVSWVRHRDLHVLTVGHFTYTTDVRFGAHYGQSAGDWSLQIKSVQPRDSGLYDCQIGTQPPKSFSVRLQVYVPRSVIAGGSTDIHVQEGSTINITCTVYDSVQPPAFFFWYHDGQVIHFNNDRQERRMSLLENDITVSSLSIRQAVMSDSGNYTCQPANSDKATVRLHILKGEEPAAMQRSSANYPLLFPLTYLWLHLLFRNYL
ncbi:hypothetical protein QYM36_000374 [Artemia franciscana]|uniref:Ig-like domain-containing protein n=1 Tax=Artemia franciscana TaxID=6661 RepID=A0AA88LC24_ARTSF|nr:hypothetical protein QYM36_000374 [Artemia franciscana]